MRIDAIATPAASQVDKTRAPAEAEQAAKQFEAIFLRQLLGSLERTTKSSGSGGTIYGSMIVDSMADAIAEAGGLGLRRELLRAIAPQR